MYALILLDNLQLSFVEPFSAPQKHFCLLMSNCERFVAHRPDALFLRSLYGILAYPPTVPLYADGDSF